MKPITIFSALYLSIALMPACSKETQPVVGEVATIQFISPVPSAHLNRSDSVAFVAVAEVNAGAPASQTLHGYDLVIRAQGDTTALHKLHVHTHGRRLDIARKWLCPPSGTSAFEAEIRVYVDHDGGFVSRKLAFFCL